MIRSFYFRLVVIVLLVVWFSIALSSFTTSKLFRFNMSDRFEERLRSSAQTTASLLQSVGPSKLDEVVPTLSKLIPMHEYELYEADGQLTASAPGAGRRLIPLEAVSRVLEGEAYTGHLERENKDEPPLPYTGFPFIAEGEKYALFVYPDTKRQIRDFENLRNQILINVLVIGSILIVIASRYLVRPVKKITEATHRIAKGDFDVSLDIRQKDELGSLAESIRHMAGELKKMEEMRQTFVSNVSHDIQTPLTSIRGFSKLLQNDALPPEERLSYLKIIEQESERLSRLSENLLKLASLESENYPFHPVPVKLDEQLRRVAVACEPLWSAKGLELRLDLPKAVVVADEDSLNQVWSNLLHNSIKFTPEGGRIDISLTTGPELVKVKIADTGIGISKQDRERMFERFFKADASRSEHGGSGLGLAIVREIVVLHGGAIDAQGEPGEGTTITVTLPLQPALNPVS